MWKIESVVSLGEYNAVRVFGHPNAFKLNKNSKSGYVLEHRIVMENYLNRTLDPNEIAHHINGNKKDNRVENLEVMSVTKHKRLHGFKQGRLYAEIICPNCQKVFHKPYNQTSLGKNCNGLNYCSVKCAFQFQRKTIEMKEAVSVNIVRVYRKYTLDNTEGTEDNQTP